MSNIFSAIDIGSNAIRLMIAERNGQGLRILKKIRAPVRLGKDVFENGQITSKTMAEAEEAFQKFLNAHRKYHVEKYKAVATSASREAVNGSEFVRYIRQKTGLDITLIDGNEEARLINLAISKELDLHKKKTLGIDVGGGSVEITFAEDGKMQSTKSFPLGTVRILELLRKRNLSEQQIEILLGEKVAEISQHIHRFTDGNNLDFAVGTGGNLECMGRLKVQLLKKTPNTFVTLEELGQIIHHLRKLTYKQRIEKLELRPDRADVIIPACLLVELILKQAEVEKLVLPAVGLRDGIIWSLLEK